MGHIIVTYGYNNGDYNHIQRNFMADYDAKLSPLVKFAWLKGPGAVWLFLGGCFISHPQTLDIIEVGQKTHDLACSGLTAKE